MRHTDWFTQVALPYAKWPAIILAVLAVALVVTTLFTGRTGKHVADNSGEDRPLPTTGPRSLAYTKAKAEAATAIVPTVTDGVRFVGTFVGLENKRHPYVDIIARSSAGEIRLGCKNEAEASALLGGLPARGTPLNLSVKATSWAAGNESISFYKVNPCQ